MLQPDRNYQLLYWVNKRGDYAAAAAVLNDAVLAGRDIAAATFKSAFIAERNAIALAFVGCETRANGINCVIDSEYHFQPTDGKYTRIFTLQCNSQRVNDTIDLIECKRRFYRSTTKAIPCDFICSDEANTYAQLSSLCCRQVSRQFFAGFAILYYCIWDKIMNSYRISNERMRFKMTHHHVTRTHGREMIHYHGAVTSNKYTIIPLCAGRCQNKNCSVCFWFMAVFAGERRDIATLPI